MLLYRLPQSFRLVRAESQNAQTNKNKYTVATFLLPDDLVRKIKREQPRNQFE
jgi:hypothetical protein